jgi:hypothetical protein
MSDSMQKQLTIDRLREQLAQAEADRDLLATMALAYQRVVQMVFDQLSGNKTENLTKAVQDAVDASNACIARVSRRN